MLKCLEKLINYNLENLKTLNILKIMKNENEYLSLYEFLGKAAGKDLGKRVYEHAKNLKIKCQTHEISNPLYEGKVLTYPKSFLEDYFSTMPTKDSFLKNPSICDIQDYDFPF